MCLHFLFEEKEYNFCKKEYINIVHKIIEGKENLQANVILMLAGKLDFFKEIILRNELVEYQWKKYPTPENFEIGLRCAIKLYNNQQFSDCLLILNNSSENLSSFKKKQSEIQTAPSQQNFENATLSTLF